MDTRKSAATSSPGTLVELQDGIINSGQELLKRRALVKTALPSNCFGLQATNAGLITFGSIDQLADDQLAEFPVTASGFLVTYQRLIHPDGSTAMISVIDSCAFQGLPFVLAEFAGGKIFAYFNGALVHDFTDGVVLAHVSTNPLRATALAAMINAQGLYSAAVSATNTSQVIISGLLANDFELATVTTTAAGTLTIERLNLAWPGAAASHAVGSFRIVAGQPGFQATKAFGFATAGTAQATHGQTCAVNGRTYTFVTSLTDFDQVKIGATLADTITALIAALNFDPVLNGTTAASASNTHYVASAHATVGAAVKPGFTYQLTLQARQYGYAGNLYTQNWIGQVSADFASYTGGDYGIYKITVGGIDVIAPQSAPTPPNALVSIPVNWQGSNENTAARCAAAINSYSDQYRAENHGNEVRIFALTAGTGYNQQELVVHTYYVAVDDCAFQITGDQFTISSIRVNDLEGLDAAYDFDGPGAGDLIEGYISVGLRNGFSSAAVLNDYFLVGMGDTAFLSRRITGSAYPALIVSVDITPTPDHTGEVIFRRQDVVPFEAIATTTVNLPLIEPWTSETIGLTIHGGVMPFRYDWRRVSGDKRIVAASRKEAATAFRGSKRIPAGTETVFHCLITDATGLTTASNQIVVVTADRL